MNDATEVAVNPMGFINPHVPPTTQKENTFRTDDSKEFVRASIEKRGSVEVNLDEAHEENFLLDPYHPFHGLPEEKHRIVTIRAIVVGIICGALVNASNVYLGLKSGWTFSANLFGAIVGFAVIKTCSRTFAENFPILGGDFGPRENNIVQTAATAAGGMSNVFVSALPALYQLELMNTPKADFWRIVSFTAVGGYFGFFFSTPLRKFFIIYVARELNLIFPTASATAMTIRSMHEAVNGEAVAKLKMRALGGSFVAAFLLRVVSQYAVGILWDWHIFTWFYIWGNYNNKAIYFENWYWYLEFTPAFIGSGMLVGLNVSISFFMGSVIAWGIIGPILVQTGTAFGMSPLEGDPKWGEWVSYGSLGLAFSNKEHPSPRFWLLWPGVLCMIAVSFTELFLQWRVIIYAGKALWRGVCKGIFITGRRFGQEYLWFQRRGEQKEDDMVEDPAVPEELVKMWMWLPGLLATIICICVVLGVQYGMPVGESLLSVFLAFFFSFLAVQCTGVTDITPLTAASKASQIVLGGATKSEGWEISKAQRLNLLGGAVANIGANQATDLVADFRVGFLLRTPPNQQWLAQGIGTICAVFLAPAMFMLFAEAYPCVIDLNVEKCQFALPSVAAWRATAVAVTDPNFPVPTSSGIFAIVFACFGSFLVFVRHFVWVGKWEFMRKYHPNMMCIALAFTINASVYGSAMCMGSFAAWIWAKKAPASFDVYGYAVAAGLIAGEGIGGVINAIFQVAGIAGDKYGTQVACPGDSC
ncbi:oligopeptide transporter [Patellaria atrata CBS 101060]|uniref:Oligopeptide transporter n=1 Tax=Patellaria atrata CBS 101060 TaxID=1346257 RepID=A0A9P4S325_9PEZI|nr:oligopeptide transporter [Patellaria atrata CBS 101060]